MEAVDRFKIYVDRLRNGKRESLTGEIPPSILEIEGEELVFPYPIEVKGEAYETEENLVLHLDCTARCQLPCSICNEPTEVPVEVTGLYHVVPFAEIKGGIFDYSVPLREALLIAAPEFVECNEGRCDQREAVAHYLKRPEGADRMDSNPFSDLN